LEDHTFFKQSSLCEFPTRDISATPRVFESPMPHIPMHLQGYLVLACEETQEPLSSLDCTDYDFTDYSVPWYYLPPKRQRDGIMYVTAATNLFDIVTMGISPCLQIFPNIIDMTMYFYIINPIPNLNDVAVMFYTTEALIDMFELMELYYTCDLQDDDWFKFSNGYLYRMLVQKDLEKDFRIETSIHIIYLFISLLQFGMFYFLRMGEYFWITQIPRTLKQLFEMIATIYMPAY